MRDRVTRAGAPQAGPVRARCPWCPEDDPLYCAYHDREWGVPIRDGARLFEMLNLEGAQAGLSWRTVLGKRARYREVFEGFEVERLVAWDEVRVAEALKDPGIIRNRLKVAGVVRNARAWDTAWGGDPKRLSQFLWEFVGGRPLRNAWKAMAEVPARTEASDAMSRELRRLGFTFVGSTICYAFMQAVGMVNDHVTSCHRWAVLDQKGR